MVEQLERTKTLPETAKRDKMPAAYIHIEGRKRPIAWNGYDNIPLWVPYQERRELRTF